MINCKTKALRNLSQSDFFFNFELKMVFLFFGVDGTRSA